MKKLILPWKNLHIKISYEANYSKSTNELRGFQLAHISVQSEKPLPITETGYRSIFLDNAEVEQAGGAVAFVNDLLNEAAKSKEWKDYIKKQSQLKLF